MRLAERLSTLRSQPWVVLVPLVAAQWIAVGIFAATVPRNDWLFYQGGDQTWFYTSGWVLAHGHIPETFASFLWPFILAPLTLVAGANFLDGLPAIVTFQFLFLLPVALLTVYALAARIGGRMLGYGAAAAWIVAPYAVTPLFVDRYHERWVDQTLPQLLGLTGLGDFPSMVFVLVAALFVLRALDGGGRSDAIAAGLVTGFALGIKPANGLFVFAPLAAFAVARRWREGLAFAAAIIPAVVTLTLWKYRGTGISILAFDPVYLAAEQQHPSQQPWWEQAKQFVPLDPHQINQQFLGFREYFWSARLLEYVPIAGAVGVARRSPVKALFLVVWLLAFFVVKGSSEAVNVETASFWRLLMPAWPAYFLLAVSLPLLVPVWGPRLAARHGGVVRQIRWPRPVVAAVALALAVPLVLCAALPPSRGGTAAKLPLQSLFLPIQQDVGLSVVATEDGVQLEWEAEEPVGANTFTIVYRSPIEYTLEPTDPRVIRQGLLCEPTGHAPRCTIEMDEVGRTRGRTFVDRPRSGTWTYRIGIAANWRDDDDLGDPFVLSTPLNVRVG